MYKPSCCTVAILAQGTSTSTNDVPRRLPASIAPAMPESRCGLYHVASGKLIAKYGWGDCTVGVSSEAFAPATRRSFDNGDHANKLQRVGPGKQLIWIRNDHHPQRCLYENNGKISWTEVWSNSDERAQWVLDFKETPEVQVEGKKYTTVLFALSNRKSGSFLACDGTSMMMGKAPDLWGWIPLSSAFTPGATAGFCVGIPFATAGLVTVTMATAGMATAGLAASAAAAEATATATTAVQAVCTGTSLLTIAGEVFAAATAMGTAASASAGLATAVTCGSIGVGCGVVAITAGSLIAALPACAPADKEELYV